MTDNVEHLVRVAARVFSQFGNLRIDRSTEDATTLRIELYLALRDYTIYPEGRVFEVMRAAAERMGVDLPLAAAKRVAELVWADTRWSTGSFSPMSSYLRRVYSELPTAPPTPDAPADSGPYRLPPRQQLDNDPWSLQQTLFEIRKVMPALEERFPGERRLAFEFMEKLTNATIGVVQSLSRRADSRGVSPEHVVDDAEKARLEAILDLTTRLEKVEARLAPTNDATEREWSGSDIHKVLQLCCEARDRSQQSRDTNIKSAIDEIYDFVARIAAHLANAQTPHSPTDPKISPSTVVAFMAMDNLRKEIHETRDQWTDSGGFTRGFRPSTASPFGKQIELTRLLGELAKVVTDELTTLHQDVADCRRAIARPPRPARPGALSVPGVRTFSRRNFASSAAGVAAGVQDEIDATVEANAARANPGCGVPPLGLDDPAPDFDGWARSVLAAAVPEGGRFSIKTGPSIGKYVIVVDGSTKPTDLDDVIPGHVISPNVGGDVRLFTGDVVMFERRAAMRIGHTGGAPIADILSVHVDNLVAILDPVVVP